MDKIVNDNNDLNTDVTIKPAPKNWLQRLKEESWEAELLVSAIAIFGTFQLFGVISWGTNKFIDILDPSQYIIGYIIIFFGLFAVSILAAMFVIHFFLRAYWIGLVGLNSVFPDYSIEDSAYSKVYTEKILSILPKLEDSIKKVDEVCSVIFSAAFTFLIIYTYMAFFASLYLVVFNMLSNYIPSYILLIPLVLILIVIIFQTAFTIIANLKKNKEKTEMQLMLFKIVKFTSIVIYGPIYKSILQVTMIFGSNFKKKKSLVYLMISCLLFGAFVAIFQLNKTNIPYLILGDDVYFDTTKVYPSFYESYKEGNNFLLTPQIESDRIKSNLVKVFIPIFSNEKRLSKKVCEVYQKDYSLFEKGELTERRQMKLDCYKAYNFIYLNGEKIAMEFLKYEHPRTNQFGVVGYIPMVTPKLGKNIVTIKKEYSDEFIKEWNIPFYYSSK